ncbi:MAG TPA: hypothetical protein VMY34_06495, partial [Acidimicrobiales bacterium]|nr:hypothetical protein [Acidimicrobiales bacterium]
MSRSGIALLCAVAACGDEPICPSEVFVAIQTSQITADANATDTGIQASVRVRTSLDAGEEVTLLASSDTSDFEFTATALTDAEGIAIFDAVTVTGPEIRLHASVSVFCGDAEDELVVPVSLAASCILTFAPAPDASAFYAPAGVYNSRNDADPETPGYQAKAIVNTAPHTSVEIFENTGTGELSLGTFDAGLNGFIEIDHTLFEGPHTYRAFCTNSAMAAVSAPISIFTDTSPPACSFAVPGPGTTITPALDTDPNAAGIQLLVLAQILGEDIVDEPTTLTITPQGGSATAAPSSTVNSDGQAGGSVTLNTPATFTFEFTTSDHAQNVCTTSEDYVVTFDTCALSVTAPTAPITADADGNPGNGSQVDITVQGSAECVGQTLTSTCGTNQPSGVIPAGGALTLRADWCATSPCEQTASCTLSVSTASTSASITFDDQGPSTSVAVVAPAVSCGSTLAV